MKNTDGLLIYVVVMMFSFGLGALIGGVAKANDKRKLMQEAHKLGYAQQFVDENDKVTYGWSDFHEVEKHYSEIEEK